MNLDFITEMIMPLALAGCLVIGYLIKNFMPGDNKWIPVIVTIAGMIIACWSTKSIEPQTIIAGAVTGLASTGLHQLLKETLKLGQSANEK